MMIFNFRKIASAVASMGLIGSTVALAAAASYPAPFVKNGASDVAIVYGSNLDLSAVTDISTSLSNALPDSSDETTAGDPIGGGDFIKLAKDSNNVNLGNEASAVFGTNIDDDDLPTLLKDGTYRNDENTEFDYEQKMSLMPYFVLSHFADNDYNNEEPTVGINITSNKNIMNYTLDFVDNAESDVVSGDLIDLETTDIVMMGRNYFIFDADNATSKLTLLDSANSGIASEGETVTVTTDDGTSYQVKIDFISSTAAKLNVNGEVTNSLKVGETYRLSGDSYIGIKEINKLEVSGEVGNVEFSIGKGKLELPHASNIELNDKAVNTISSYIRRGSTNGGKETINKIELAWTTDKDEFIAPGDELVMPGFSVVKFSMNDFLIPNEELLTVKDAGTTEIALTADLEKGRVTIPLIYANATGEFAGFGEDSNDLLVTTNKSAVVFNETKGDEWLVVSWNSTNEAETYVLEAAGWIKESGVNKTTISWLTEGNVWEEKCVDKKAGDTCDIGSLTLNINQVRFHNNEKSANLSSTDAAVSFNILYTKNGLRLDLPYVGASVGTTAGIAAGIRAYGAVNFTANNSLGKGHGFDTVQLHFIESDKDDNIAAGTNFSIMLDDNSDKEVEVSLIESKSQNFKEIEDDDNLVTRVKSDLATKVRRIGSSSDQREVEIYYSGGEAYADIFLTDVSVSTGGSGELGGISVMDSELATSGMQTKNLVVVGGTCVNTAAASLLGVSSPTCGPSWASVTGVGAGQFLVETFTNPWSSSKIATLVAGYEQGDTKNAATWFTTQTVDTTVGKKYTGTSATSATLVAG